MHALFEKEIGIGTSIHMILDARNSNIFVFFAVIDDVISAAM